LSDDLAGRAEVLATALRADRAGRPDRAPVPGRPGGASGRTRQGLPLACARRLARALRRRGCDGRPRRDARPGPYLAGWSTCPAARPHARPAHRAVACLHRGIGRAPSWDDFHEAMTAGRLLSLLCLAVCATALVGCGGDALSFDPVANAATKTADTTSSR